MHRNTDPNAHATGEAETDESRANTSEVDVRQTKQRRNRLAVALFVTIGCIAVGLGSLGVVLPLLPTTPLLLLAAFCFAKSSTRLHQKLLKNRFLGPPIRRWQETRTLSRRTKAGAITLVLVSFGVSILSIPSVVDYPIVCTVCTILVVVAIVLVVFLARISSTRSANT